MISADVLITVYLRIKQSVQLLESITARGSGPSGCLQLDDVWMSEQLQILDLALDTASHVPADELLPGNDLESNLLTSAPMHGQLHFAK